MAHPNYVVNPPRGPDMLSDDAIGRADSGLPSPTWPIPRALEARGMQAGEWLPASNHAHPFLYNRALHTEFFYANEEDEADGHLANMDQRIEEQWETWVPIYVPPDPERADERGPQDPRNHPMRQAYPWSKPGWF